MRISEQDAIEAVKKVYTETWDDACEWRPIALARVVSIVINAIPEAPRSAAECEELREQIDKRDRRIAVLVQTVDDLTAVNRKLQELVQKKSDFLSDLHSQISVFCRS